MQVIKEFPFVKYFDDGTVEVFGNKDGCPKYTGVVPAPDINTDSEKKREARYREACENIVLQGFLIITQKRIHNQAFDGRDQRTTLRITYRPAKNDEETKEVYRQIKEILENRVKKELVQK